MTATQKFLANALSTFTIGMLTAAMVIYTDDKSAYFLPVHILLLFAFVIGIVIMPIHVLFNLALHLKGFIDIKRIPVSYLISQSVILMGVLSFVFYFESTLPDDLVLINGTNEKHWYFQTAWLVAFSYVPLVIFTVATGRWLHKMHSNANSEQ